MDTQDHPITPPPELVQQLWNSHDTWTNQIIAAYQAGADQELEACCEQLKSIPSPLGIPFGEMASNALRAARRPKPPSLKEQALAVLMNAAICDHLSPQDEAILRRALEALDD